MAINGFALSLLTMKHRGEDSGIWILLPLLSVCPGSMYLTSLNVASITCDMG